MTSIALLAVGCSPGDPATRLHAAIERGDAGAVNDSSLPASAIEARDGAGETPLVHAARLALPDVIEALVRRGADPRATDPNGRSALGALAIEARPRGSQPRAVAALVAAGVSPDAPDSTGETPLMAATRMGRTELVAALLSAGAFVDALDAGRFDALDYASLTEAPAELFNLLVSHGADVNRRTRAENSTRLISAARLSTPAMAERLIRAGADIEAEDARGRTAVFYAAMREDPAMLALLLDRGADATRRDREGDSPADCARENRREACRRLLDERGLLASSTTRP